MQNNCYALILAAGSGTRLQTYAGVKKQFLEYLGKPLWWQSVQTFYNSPHIKGVVLVFPPSDEEFAAACAHAKALIDDANLGIDYTFAKGGETRCDSVYHGLSAMPKDCTHVLIHDSARPFFSAKLVHALCTSFTSTEYKAVIPAIAVTDTIKVVREGTVQESLERSTLRAVQTPQAFEYSLILDAHQRIRNEGQLPLEAVTDDAMLAESFGHQVLVLDGEEKNIKITHEKDLDLLKIPQKQIPCTGYGYDVHAFGGERPFILGGVKIPTSLTIKAHSDGDVLLHALMDALLSCLGQGDIGKHFPDSDKKFENISSSLLLDQVMDLWRKSNLELCHVDLTVICQAPKVTPHAAEIKKNISRLLELDASCINVKATTEEKLGFTGQGQGIKAVALVSALKNI